MRYYLYPYKLYSSSAKLLAENLNIKRLKESSTAYKPSWERAIINWGNSKIPVWDTEDTLWINFPEAVGKATNKLSAFKTFLEMDVCCPQFFTDKQQIKDQLSKHTFFARKLLQGHSGAGIVIVNEDNFDSIQAPLFVKYVKKKQEYRVHIFFDKVIDCQIKRKQNGWKESEIYSSLIRNHHTGWVYCRENLQIDDRCAELAIKAVNSLNLNFGAVDIIYNQKEDKYYVLEVNTAPGLEGTTLESYLTSFKELFHV